MKRRWKKSKRSSRRAVAAILPNLMTLGNAVCGFSAVVFIAGAASGWTADQGLLAAFTDQKLVYACWCVFGAMVFDALDGSVARMTRQTSSLGAQLDSLCDAVTFTVVPAFMVWKVVSLLPRDVIHIHPKASWVLAVLYMVFGILRLARFNVEKSSEAESHESFNGLPTPAAAAVIASLTLLAVDILLDGGGRYEWITASFFLAIPIIAFFLGILMVSRVPYPHVLNRLLRGRRPFAYLVQIIFVLAMLALLPYSFSLAFVALFYVAAGLVLHVRQRFAAQASVEAPAQLKEPGP